MTLLWKVLYEDGATVEEIALEFGVSATYARRSLLDVGTAFRKAGARAGVKHGNVAHARRASKVPEPTAQIMRPSVARRYR